MNLLLVKGKHNLYELIMTVLVSVLTGSLAALLVRDYCGGLLKGAAALAAYGVMWLILLVLMGFSSYRAKLIKPDSPAHVYYALQLLTVFLWHIIFFRFQNAGIGFGIIIVYIYLIIMSYFEFDKIDKTAGYLILPAVLWAIAAAGCNFMIIK